LSQKLAFEYRRLKVSPRTFLSTDNLLWLVYSINIKRNEASYEIFNRRYILCKFVVSVDVECKIHLIIECNYVIEFCTIWNEFFSNNVAVANSFFCVFWWTWYFENNFLYGKCNVFFSCCQVLIDFSTEAMYKLLLLY